MKERCPVLPLVKTQGKKRCSDLYLSMGWEGEVNLPVLWGDPQGGGVTPKEKE